MTYTIDKVSGVGVATQSILAEAGYKSVEALAAASVAQISNLRGFGPVRASRMIAAAKAMLKTAPEQPAQKPISAKKPKNTAKKKPITKKNSKKDDKKKSDKKPKKADKIKAAKKSKNEDKKKSDKKNKASKLAKIDKKSGKTVKDGKTGGKKTKSRKK